MKSLLSLLLCGTLLGCLPPLSAFGQNQHGLQITAAQMKAILQCPDDTSKQFVDDCFELVRLGKLPEVHVLSAFQFASAKPKGRWIYFEKVLYLRTEKAGINLKKLIQDLHRNS
ncbi:MAG: hypothetical protein Q4D62_05730 [Planctomycetia bacterium]|nr:hypothetical protein [Planctomycetia bacterium]